MPMIPESFGDVIAQWDAAPRVWRRAFLSCLNDRMPGDWRQTVMVNGNGFPVDDLSGARPWLSRLAWLYKRDADRLAFVQDVWREATDEGALVVKMPFRDSAWLNADRVQS